MVEQSVGQQPTCGGYTILRTIGDGGTASIKLVEKNGVRYAMKIFSPGDSEEEKQRVLQKTKYEYELLQGKSIKNIMKYYEFNENAVWRKKNGTQSMVCYLVMELLDGVELLDFLNECGEQSDEFVRYIFLEIANTIHQLHKAGIAHRDIKPENIMITSDFQIKLIDLGFGRPLGGRTGTGYMNSRLGTPMYMAPEIRDKRQPYQGQDADIFAFGVSLFVARVIDYPWLKPDLAEDEGYKLIAGDNGLNADKFWEQYEDRQLSEDFKNMITSIMQFQPTTRPTMADILGHPWMRGNVMSKQNFDNQCQEFMALAKAEQRQKHVKLGIDHSVEKRARRAFDNDLKDIENDLLAREFRPQEQVQGKTRAKQIAVSGKPMNIMKVLYSVAKESGFNAQMSKTHWKFSFQCDYNIVPAEQNGTTQKQDQENEQEEEAESFIIDVELHQLQQNEEYIVVIGRKGGPFITFNKTYQKFLEALKEDEDVNTL